jgi:hypothetical protein
MADWLANTLPTLESDWGIERTPTQQLDSLVGVFASGEVLCFEQQFKPLGHLGEGVWELKTPDLRVFGWFPQRDCFIADRADLASRIKQHHLYRGYVGEVVRFRNDLDLDEPKFLTGEDPRYVVSNFSFPN